MLAMVKPHLSHTKAMVKPH